MVIAGMATLAYLGTAYAVDSEQIAAAVQRLGWLGCGLVLTLSCANYAIRFQRWQSFMARLGYQFPFGRHLLYYLSGFAFTVTPAKAGEAVRSLYLHAYGVPYSQSIAALFVERLQDLLAMGLLASLVVAGRPAYLPLVGSALLLVLTLLAIASRDTSPAALERLGRALPQRRFVALLTAGARLLRTSNSLLQPRLLVTGTATSVAAWSAEGLGYFLICRGLHIDISLLGAMGVYALAVLAGSAAFFLPAGLGGMELVMTSLLVAQGEPVRVALAATLLCRLATLWFAVLIGMAAATVVELGPQSPRLEPAP
jgi:uncharacterized membrane protein YbhN (UPF0104 family)